MKEITIRADKKFSLSSIYEIWTSRSLFYTIVWRDIKVRYKQTIIGVIWAILQPLISTIVFTIFFGNLAKVPSGDLPYSLFVLVGLVFWTFFSNSLTYASDSLVSNEVIIKRIYFPKIILPFTSVAKGFVDFSINVVLMFIFAAIIGYFPHFQALFIIPLAIIMTIMTASGLGLFLASLNVKYRDVRYILPYFIQMLLFFNPVIYPLGILSEKKRYFMALNPITSVVESVRLVFVGNTVLHPTFLVISTISAICIFIFGVWYFHKTERFFADYI